jgi:hypothetical protein
MYFYTNQIKNAGIFSIKLIIEVCSCINVYVNMNNFIFYKQHFV